MRTLLQESVTYQVPNSPEVIMADFYMLSWLSSVNPDAMVKAGRTKMLRYDDFAHDVDHASSVMLPFLKAHMLEAVFFAMCAEIRHYFSRSQRGVPSPLLTYSKYYHHYASHAGSADPRKPEDAEQFKDSNRGYQDSYAAVVKAMSSKGYDHAEMVDAFKDAFSNGAWGASYGGQAWANIADGWIRLYGSRSQMDLYIAIDHIYDLQHNSDTVFNKLKSYYRQGGYFWIKKMLDFKANLKDMSELIPKCSSQMKKMARPVLMMARSDDDRPEEEKQSEMNPSLLKKAGAPVTGSDLNPAVDAYIKAPNDLETSMQEVTLLSHLASHYLFHAGGGLDHSAAYAKSKSKVLETYAKSKVLNYGKVRDAVEPKIESFLVKLTDSGGKPLKVKQAVAEVIHEMDQAGDLESNKVLDYADEILLFFATKATYIEITSKLGAEASVQRAQGGDGYAFEVMKKDASNIVQTVVKRLSSDSSKGIDANSITTSLVAYIHDLPKDWEFLDEEYADDAAVAILDAFGDWNKATGGQTMKEAAKKAKIDFEDLKKDVENVAATCILNGHMDGVWWDVVTEMEDVPNIPSDLFNSLEMFVNMVEKDYDDLG